MTDWGPLHQKWWLAASELSAVQAQECKCWPPARCDTCMPAALKLLEAEVALKEAQEWH